MKLLSPAIEKQAIRSICSSPRKVAGQILANINEDFFYYDPTKEAFKRILKLARTRGLIPEYEELCNDPAISESSRKSLIRNKQEAVTNRKRGTRLVRNMDEYRKLRGLYFDAEATLEALKASNVNVDELLAKKNENLTKLRTNSQRQNAILNMGKGSNVSALIKDILYGERDQLIPTGFKVFDDENGGIPPTALFVIASNSGGGKCIVASSVVETVNGSRRIGDVWTETTGVEEPYLDGVRKVLDQPIEMRKHDGSTGWATHMFKTKGKTIRITLEDGRILQGLAEHKVKIRTVDGYDFVRMDQLTEEHDIVVVDEASSSSNSSAA